MKLSIAATLAVLAFASSQTASAAPLEDASVITIPIQKRGPTVDYANNLDRYLNHLDQISAKYSSAIEASATTINLVAAAKTGKGKTSKGKTSKGKTGKGKTVGKGKAAKSAPTPAPAPSSPAPAPSAPAPAPAPAPPAKGKGKGKGKSSEVPLAIEGNDEAYFGTVQVGGQSFNIDFDTGSSDLWVPVVGCKSKGCANKNLFDPKKSKSFKSQGKNFSIRYGSGAVSGKLATETVSLGGLTATGQFFGVADTVSDDFANGKIDGLMGMAYSSINTAHQDTVFDSLIKQKAVSKPVFAFHLARAKQGGKGASLTLGGIDNSKFTGTINFHPVTQKTFWTLAADGITVNGKDSGIKGRSAAIDTGTTLIVMPQADAKAVMKNIPGSKPFIQQGRDTGLFTFPCTSKVSIALTFGGKSYAINPQDLNLGLAQQGSKDCVAGIAGMNLGLNGLWIVGDVFLKSWYSVYDAGNNQVGFAQSK
jgi:cathepsin D